MQVVLQAILIGTTLKQKPLMSVLEKYATGDSMWISVEEEKPPLFQETRQTFLAAWLDPDGEIGAVEWYSWTGGYEYWNQNSNNLNSLGTLGKINSMPMFHLWMPLPEPPQD